MTTDTLPSTTSSVHLPGIFSIGLEQIIERMRPSVVQVRREGHGAGTGIVWQGNGTILTNNHVVPHDGKKVQVELQDGRVLDARVVDRDPTLDLALLHIPVDNLPTIPVGDSAKLRVGELVFAVGHPWGQRGVVTAGIVSALTTVKDRDSDREMAYIKSDVQLAPGNSGGPLLDAQGRVVGINAMIFGGDLSVAIPSNAVSNWVAGIPKTPISLGVQIQAVELPANVRQELSREQLSGLLVVGIVPGGRAEQASFLVGDILLDLAEKPLNDVASLRAVLAKSEALDKVTLHVLRGGTIVEIDVTITAAETSA